MVLLYLAFVSKYFANPETQYSHCQEAGRAIGGPLHSPQLPRILGKPFRFGVESKYRLKTDAILRRKEAFGVPSANGCSETECHRLIKAARASGTVFC